MFKPVSSKASFVLMEEAILKRWKEQDIFIRSIDARSQNQRFTLYEGPPTANGKPGIHHVLSRVFKDVLPRYKTMQGYYAPRIAGWDTHGLPVELEVEKQLGFSNKSDIEKYGIDKFNTKCRESVFKYLKDWDALTERIAYWVDLNHPYITMENTYIESGWWTIKQLWDKGLIYKGYRTTPHCPRCGTSLSSHELAQGYRDDTPDPSVYIKFKLTSKTQIDYMITAGGNPHLPFYLLAWTTTPWTLPGNTALAVSEDADYMIVEIDNENIIMAASRLEAIGLTNARIVGNIRGKLLVGARYEALYNPHSFGIERKKFTSNSQQASSIMRIQEPQQLLTYPVIATDFVTMEEGTGIVHIAPAFGEADFDAGHKHHLDFVQHVDLQGKIIGNYPFSGKFVKNADKEIISELRNRGLLFKSETIHHTYPFCWRCNAPLLYYVKQSWYIKTTAMKDRLIAGNQQINWYPEHIKNGRFGDWLNNNVDWAFSRERYWGTPIPIWQCEQCSYQECIGSLEELRGKSGLINFNEPLDLHRPYIDDVRYTCPHCTGIMIRVTDVIDCWFDSGNMPIAQWHYPFDETSRNIFKDKRFPADYICEAVDQTRGWFYSLHVISILLFDQPCYQNVICLGHILDANGEKMSKSRGNVVDPWTILNKYGADALRWYLLTAAPPGNARRFSEELVSEVTRQFMLILWNVYSFFVTYANIDQFNPSTSAVPIETSELDCWLNSEINQLISTVTDNLDNYNITDAGRAIETFVVEYLSNWYVRRSRRRFWKSENDADKISAYHTLYNCLITLAKLLAPFMPFLADEIYCNLILSINPQATESVHLADFPKVDTTKIDTKLSTSIRLAMKLSSLGRAARSQAGIKVRQPVGTGYIQFPAKNDGEIDAFMRVKPQLLEELNIKDIETIDKIDKLDASKYSISTDGIYSIAIPNTLSPELLAEGMAREIVHRLQTLRKNAGFEIADYITTYFQGDEYIDNVVKGFADYIKNETLTSNLINTAPPATAACKEEYRIDKHPVILGVLKDNK
jgi:isoleucyl-tRNA synthetase